MKLTTLNRIIDWKNKYQPDLTPEEGKELYYKLVEEEELETELAYSDRNLKEYLDGLGDMLWTMTIKEYFMYDNVGIYMSNIYNILDEIETNLKYNGRDEDILDDLINKIADSNFTKDLLEKEKGEKAGKVVKGANFVKPDIQSIIDKYNITWK